MTTALVLGDTGLLGQAMTAELVRRGARVLGVSTSASARARAGADYRHERLDAAAEPERLFERLDDFGPSVVVNCAGLADVNGCETDPGAAEALNAALPAELAAHCAKRNVAFVHVSTDQVFDGRASAPYAESDAPRPLHAYGRTKLAGERAALRHGALAARTNLVGLRGAAKPAFAEWLCAALISKTPITLAEDFVTSSIHAGALSCLLLDLCAGGARGLFHVATRDAASKYEFGARLARALGADFSAVKRGRLSDLRLEPARPGFLALDVTEAEKALGRELPRIDDTIAALKRDLAASERKVGAA